jgi:hypothetical protein
MRETELLYEALNSELGIEVELVGNYQASLQRLDTARRKDPDLEIIQIHKSPTSPNHLWLVRNENLRHPNAEQQTFAPATSAANGLSVQPVKQNPQGEGPLYSLADLGDD